MRKVGSITLVARPGLPLKPRVTAFPFLIVPGTIVDGTIMQKNCQPSTLASR